MTTTPRAMTTEWEAMIQRKATHQREVFAKTNAERADLLALTERFVAGFDSGYLKAPRDHACPECVEGAVHPCDPSWRCVNHAARHLLAKIGGGA